MNNLCRLSCRSPFFRAQLAATRGDGFPILGAWQTIWKHQRGQRPSREAHRLHLRDECRPGDTCSSSKNLHRWRSRSRSAWPASDTLPVESVECVESIESVECVESVAIVGSVPCRQRSQSAAQCPGPPQLPHPWVRFAALRLAPATSGGFRHNPSKTSNLSKPSKLSNGMLHRELSHRTLPHEHDREKSQELRGPRITPPGARRVVRFLTRAMPGGVLPLRPRERAEQWLRRRWRSQWTLPRRVVIPSGARR